ncbi:unnamed protein product [Clonostachys solani]|uniref:NACHT domain-containing protein n=1 Tax=Clonostachys solani TaxID=160281 RepID=A0A9N9YXT6_9HYPO|nr:unnamed protein product [Clonostachys solani]
MIRQKLRERLDRLRRKPSRLSNDADANVQSTQAPQRNLLAPTISGPAPSVPAPSVPAPSVPVPSVPGSITHNQTSTLRPAGDPIDKTGIQSNQGALLPGPKSNETSSSTTGSHPDTVLISSDLWSAAYSEAVRSFGKDLDVATLQGKNMEQLFKQLEALDKDSTQQPGFQRGVGYLRSIQVPLERFKLALDLTSPLATGLGPTTSVVGAVRSVTAIAITFATADREFAKQIGEMLEQISYIDDCDTLGQQSDKQDIHKALVSVYRKMLMFYQAALEILSKQGAKLMLKMALETHHLPQLVQDFLRHADVLRKLVQKATWEIVEDIKTMLYDREIAIWLGSDKMSDQSQYHASLQDLRADRACEPLLANTNFIDWYNAPEFRELVVLGQTGCGKTVSMAFLVDSLMKMNEHLIPQPKICYYYCRGNETGEAVHIISSLILALLGQLPGLKKTFFEWYKQAQASGCYDPATDYRKLEEFLELVFQTLNRQLFIIIDGLDECGRGSRSTLLKLFKKLSQRNTRLKVILSSRPQEEILTQLDRMPRIFLDTNVTRDGIIVEKLVQKRLSYLSNDVAEFVIQVLSRKAQGSAIWAKMVIDLIEIRGIRAPGPMRRFLEEEPLPKGLYELYNTLLSRCTADDFENEALAHTALRLLAVSRRPLSILELAWAVTLGATKEDILSISDLTILVDYQRVMSLIHPFVTRLDFGDLKKRQVGLVHQSVKEFILSECDPTPPLLLSSGSRAFHKRHIGQNIEYMEACALEICVKYLLLEEIGNQTLFSEEQIAIEELPQGFDLFDSDGETIEYDPYCSWDAGEENMILYDPADRGFGEFFAYASCYWVDHLGAVTKEPQLHLPGIEKLCEAGSTRIHNWIEQNRRPGCTIKPRFEFDASLYDPVTIMSLYGSDAMLRSMLEESDFNSMIFYNRPILGAADQIIQWGDLSRLKILFLDDRVGQQLQILDFFLLLMSRWSYPRVQHQSWDLAFDLINQMLDLGPAIEQWGNELLCVAAGMGCMPVICRLMMRARRDTVLRIELLRGAQREQGTHSMDKPLHQSIGEAVWCNHVHVVEYLLGVEGIEAHIAYLNSRGENILHLASRYCNPAVFRILTPRFQLSMQQKDNSGNTALMRIMTSSALLQDRLESARILLSHAATIQDYGSQDEQQESLRMAVRLGELEMCDVLLSIGRADPRLLSIRNNQGEMIFPGEITDNEGLLPAIVQLLRRHAGTTSLDTDL